jgi:signal transduction histidine kinase
MTEENILIIGTLAMLLMAFSIVLFIYLYQRKLIKKNLENQQINDLLREQEMRTAYAMLEGQDKERKRIATELHDNLGSILVTLNMYADSLLNKKTQTDAATVLTKISETTSQANETVRQISHSLDSGMLRHFGLASAVRQLLEAVQLSKAIKIETEIDLPDTLPSEVSLEVYRMVQELVNNTMKHAAASRVRLELTLVKGELSMIYEDNGRGFDEQTIERGMGLNNIQQRVERLNGELKIDSKPGNGSTFIIEIAKL